MAKLPKPTDSELGILQILWAQGACTVREVNDKLNENEEKEIGYTTTLKHMQIMFEKGLVSRSKSGKTHVYTAEVSEGDTQNALLDRFIDKVFKGSATSLMLQALGRKKASAEEIKEIKQILKELDKDNGSDVSN